LKGYASFHYAILGMMFLNSYTGQVANGMFYDHDRHTPLNPTYYMTYI